MRVEATVAAVSWIPSESLQGLMQMGMDFRMGHYDAPPPDRIEGAASLRRLRDQDAFRFANLLGAWIDVHDGQITGAGRAEESGLVMGRTIVRLARWGITFHAASMPPIHHDPERLDGAVRFVQTVGGRTGSPLPRPVPHRPYVQWAGPLAWTTLALTLHPDGRADVHLVGASAFPRHWVYGPDGNLKLKSGLTDLSGWLKNAFGVRTPWGEQDSPALVTAAESSLEHQLSREIMSGHKPEIRRLPAGSVMTRQGEPGTELFLLLDGVLAVDVDGRRVAEVGPGAVVGERALLEGGRRTATLEAVTPVRVAVATVDVIDLDRLGALAQAHHREDEG
jgi:hypothetical protein